MKLLSFSKFILLFNTLKYLRVKQIYYYIKRRGCPPVNVQVGHCPEIMEGVTLSPGIPVEGIYVDETTFRFLNTIVDLGQENNRWIPAKVQRLWIYNLHYFDYLREGNRSLEEKSRLISDWIRANPQGAGPGWEPFTVSLRIVNWVKFFIGQYGKSSINHSWVNSLFEQALWLERNDESHIMANHFFENIKALLYAGVYFKGKDADRWRKRCRKLLLNQLAEQTLDDGGHYERSPMYHSLMVENYLDIYNLLDSNQNLFGSNIDECLAATKKACVSGLDYLADILFPGEAIPLFNDSAFNVAPSPASLFKYGNSLFGYKVDVSLNGLISKQDSGLFGYRFNNNMFIVDCGDIGPDYQPGHTHCDFLSYELMIEGEMIVVDTGVSEYQPGNNRAYERSTRAHNTISVDGVDQSEIWGEFRVGRRARKLRANIKKYDTGKILFTGEYEGFYSVKSRIIHSREITLEYSTEKENINSFQVDDRISGVGSHRIHNYIHFHPDIDISIRSDGVVILRSKRGREILMSIENEYRIEEGFYCPEFGIRYPGKVIVLHTCDTLPVRTSYRLTSG